MLQATVGNGLPFDPLSFGQDSRAAHTGGEDHERHPVTGPVYDPDYYAAFIIDPDRYRIEAYYGPGESEG